MKFFKKLKLITKTKKYIDYGDKNVFNLSQEELEKINALLPLIVKALTPSCCCGAEKNVEYNSIESIIKTLTITQINDLNECNLKFVEYLVDRYNEGKYDINEVIKKIVNVFKGKEAYFLEVFKTGFTIDQIEFLLKNNLTYAFSSYHKEFDYDKIYNKIKELGLSPSGEYANKFDISIITKFCNCYNKMSLAEKHCILHQAAMSLLKKDAITFFNILCAGENDCYTYEEIMVILNCDKWTMTQKAFILKKCKKEEVFAEMFEIQK